MLGIVLCYDKRRTMDNPNFLFGHFSDKASISLYDMRINGGPRRGVFEIKEQKAFYYESAVNFIVIIICWVMVFILSAGFLIEYEKGTRLLVFVLPMLTVGFLSVIAGTIFYKINPLTRYVRYATFGGFFFMYVFTLLSASTPVTFTFVFPLVTLFCLYVDRWFMIIVCSLVLLLNGIYITNKLIHVSRLEVGETAYNQFTTTMLIHTFVLLLFMSSLIAIVYVFHRLRQAMDYKIQEAHHARATGQKLYAQATIDDLTGVFNRRHFVEKVREQLDETSIGCSLLLLDIDDFKKINDVHGHLAGDKVLITFSSLLAKVYADYGIVGRVGGEEFAIFLKERSEGDSYERSERLRKMIEDSETWINEEKTISVTTSGGLVRASRGGITFEELFQQADKALYVSKNAGKNRITQAAPIE
jgi:diguanylate cyclase (GGDEF)-like protein